MTERRFFNTAPVEVFYETIEISHPVAGVRRYVKNQQLQVALGGDTYEPAAMEITASAEGIDEPVSVNVQLGRVGTQVKAYQRLISGTDLMTPIGMAYKTWRGSDTANPLSSTELFVTNVDFEADAVAITASEENPRSVGVARKYRAEDFPGLEAQI